MTLLNAKVAATIYNMVDFGSNAKEATVALCAALVAIVVWATLAWKFGIPTSESHALIAGLTGAAIAMHGGLGGVKRCRVAQGYIRSFPFNSARFRIRFFFGKTYGNPV